MGGGTSKDQVPDTEEIGEHQLAIQVKLETQLTEMRQEIEEVKPQITQDVLETTKEWRDSLILSYEKLNDTGKIVENIKTIFDGGEGVMKPLVEVATNVLKAMKTTSELKKMVHWQQRKVIQRIPGTNGRPDQVVGIEMHYKVEILDETIGRFTTHNEKKLLIAYKSYFHIMTTDPDQYLSKEEMDQVTI